MRESQYNCTEREPVRLLHWTRFPGPTSKSALGRRLLLLIKRFLSNKYPLVFLLITSFPNWESSSLPHPGGEVLKKVLYREGPSRRGSTPYPFIYHFLQKRYPYRVPSVEKWFPFHIPSLELASLSTAANALSLKHE